MYTLYDDPTELMTLDEKEQYYINALRDAIQRQVSYLCEIDIVLKQNGLLPKRFYLDALDRQGLEHYIKLLETQAKKNL